MSTRNGQLLNQKLTDFASQCLKLRQGKTLQVLRPIDLFEQHACFLTFNVKILRSISPLYHKLGISCKTTKTHGNHTLNKGLMIPLH